MNAIYSIGSIALYHFLALALPLYFSFATQELFEFNKMIFVYMVATAVTTLWLLRMASERKILWRPTPFDWVFGLFFMSQAASTIFSIDPYTSLFGYYSRFHGGLASTIAYLILFYGYINTVPRKQTPALLLSLYISASLVSVYAILEHFGHSMSCLLVPGQKTFGVGCWVQDVQSRVFATFGQPNWLAAYCVMLIPLGFSATHTAMLSYTGKKRPLIYALATTLLFVTLIYTRSRSGMLALGAGLGVFLLGLLVLSGSRPKVVLVQGLQQLRKNILFSSLGILLFGLTLVLGTTLTPSLAELSKKLGGQEQAVLTEITPEPTGVDRLEQGGTDSGEIRKIVWQGGLLVWKRYPLLGSGLETFAYSYYQDRLREHNDVSEWDFLYNKAHNEVINTAATSGVLGLVALAAIYIRTTWVVYTILVSKKSKGEKLFVLSLFSGIVALFVSNFFGFSTVTVSALQFLFLALIAQIYTENQAQTQDEQLAPRSKRPIATQKAPIYWLIVVIAFASISAFILIYRYRSADIAFAQAKAQFTAGLYQQSLDSYSTALSLAPREALFYDSLADHSAQLAATLADGEQLEAAQTLAEQALWASDTALELNPRHLNFYKTRVRVLTTLSQFDSSLLEEAQKTIDIARQLSPTDPKLLYSAAILEEAKESTQSAVTHLQEAIALKPNYLQARWRLALLYEKNKNIDDALVELRAILKNISPENPEVLQKITELENGIIPQ